MRFYFYTLLFLAGLMLSKVAAQELPPIQHFTPKMYDADNQNWSISQSQDKFIYVANDRGLLEYNGAVWNLYPTPNQSVIRSVHVIDDKIYTGCYMEFGYWQKNNFGELNYISLSEKLTNLIEDEEFWKIRHIKQWILFQSLDRIYIYDTITESFNTIEPENSITKMYVIEDEVYFQDFGKGIYKIENGSTTQIINSDVLNNTRVVGMFKQDKGLLLTTATKGFYLFENNMLSKWNIEADEFLSQLTLYSSLKLDDESLLLGSISNGIVLLDSKGKIKYHINQSKGLQNNTVLSIFKDMDQNIWLGLDNGINFINMYSPYKVYYDFSGDLGTIYTSVVFNNDIYLGTNQGLFYKSINKNEEFKFIEKTNGQVWSLDKINNELFCGHDNGTFIIKNNEANRIADIQGTWGVKPLVDDNLLIQGNYDGLNVLEKVNGNWVFRNKIEGFDISSRYFEFYDSETVFVSHEYKGVFKLKLDNDFRKVLQVEKLSQFEKGLNSSLIKYNENIYYANNEGIHNYDLIENKFIKDSVVSQLYKKNDYISGKLIPDSTNKLWNFSKNNLSYLDSASLGGTSEIITISLPDNQVNNMNGYENITNLFNGEYLIGTSNGYMILDITKLNTNNYKVSINSVEVSGLNQDLKKVNIFDTGFFENKTNNISFSFSIPEYYKFSEKRFQYQLEGYNNLWSDWTTNSSHVFENLPYGKYTFKVRGRVGNAISTNVASYSFKIEKPWYLSDTFIAIYIIGGLLILITTHLVYRAYYKKQREKLLEESKKDLELKELENKQQISVFKNETLQQDIENKNRELAISTMSLIKKNEFLGNVKNELKKINTNNDLNSVIKIIDKNINNTNDWELFEEAFNNADKDFLKKVKSKHPSLTSNDLRLCAYLRLNLSSKEIAPLLNISVRSVEVKRYRLRKKMELAHDTSLTDYILAL